MSEHAHPHAHEHNAASDHNHQLGPSRDGTVVLDIGGDIGALVLTTPEDYLAAEIEVSPVGEDTRRTHVAVRARIGPSGTRYAAIYPGLVAGDYTVWGRDGQPADRVRINGGEVAQLDWR